MGFVINMYMAGEGAFDPTWYSPTVVGLAVIENHLAATCAAIAVFWPSVERRWNKIFVTQTVSITSEYGQFPGRQNNNNNNSNNNNADIEMQGVTSSDKDQVLDATELPEGWEPFVGDESTGLGINETVIESTSGNRWLKKVKAVLSKKDHN